MNMIDYFIIAGVANAIFAMLTSIIEFIGNIKIKREHGRLLIEVDTVNALFSIHDSPAPIYCLFAIIFLALALIGWLICKQL